MPDATKPQGSAGMMARGKCQVVFWVVEEAKELIQDAASWHGESLASFARRSVIAAAQVVAAHARETGSTGRLASRKGPRRGKRLRK